jgi:hypothetical protein
MLINDAMRRINKFNVKELTTMPVGQIVGRMNKVRPVAEVFRLTSSSVVAEAGKLVE